ncbi:MAG: hypothetical protein M1820_001955 [Bogoriella megaspora]|nr:MAG: hypothetical protein M1820_001955 [Bogoriella megaspora]
MIYRRFGYLQSRLLLDKQDDLRKLEKELDDEDLQDDPRNLVTRDLAESDKVRRRDILKRIEEKFRDYASLLITSQQLVSFNTPAPGDYQSVVNYMNDKTPLVEDEAQWVKHREDMVTLRGGREHAWLDSGIEHCLKWAQCKLRAGKLVEYLFCAPKEERKSDGHAVYYDRRRINNVATGLIICAILILLIIPIYLLYHLVADVGTRQSYASCIGILLVFTLAFSAVLSLFTRARRHEILGAAAAYCAVLVVFLGNVGQHTY